MRVTAETITHQQLLDLRRDSFARWNLGEFIVRSGEPGLNLREQMEYESAALNPDGGVIGLPGYHAQRVTQAEAMEYCAGAWNARYGDSK